jgi:hypothetical protein
MLQPGKYYTLKVIREKTIGVFLDDGNSGYYYRDDSYLKE